MGTTIVSAGLIVRRLALAAILLAALAAPARGYLPPLSDPDPFCTPNGILNENDKCILDPPDKRVVQPGALVELSHNVSGSFSQAISCGDLACVFRGAIFKDFGPGLSVAGECTSYGGLGSPGAPMRDVTASPGHCVLRYDPPTLRSPGSWALVNFVSCEGIFPTGGTSHLITVEPEFYRIDVTWTGATANQAPFTMRAVRAGTNPAETACVTLAALEAAWLPARVVPDCLVVDINFFTTAFLSWLPNATWDLLTFWDEVPATGALRAVPTPWRPKRITIDHDDLMTEVVRVPRPALSVSVLLLGGDDKLAVDEDGVARVTLSTSSTDVEGQVTGITFNTANIVLVQRTAAQGNATVSTPSPVPAADLAMGPGETRTFDVPVHGTVAGPAKLAVTVRGSSPFGDFQAKSTNQPIEITSDPVPPPSGSVCGHPISTQVAAESTGAVLQLVSVNGVDAGDELVVDPCSADAEQVTAGTPAGLTVPVSPAMQKVHHTGAPVLVMGPDAGTLLRSAAAAGATTLDVLRHDGFTIGGGVVIDPGTALEEHALVTGFGSILIDPPLAKSHGVGAVVAPETVTSTTTTSAPSTSTPTTSPPATGTTTTTLPAGCAHAATLASVGCRLRALPADAAAIQVGKARSQVTAKLGTAASQVDRAAAALASGKLRPTKVAIKKALAAVKAAAKKLKAKKVAASLPEPLRSQLASALAALQADMQTLVAKPAQ